MAKKDWPSSSRFLGLEERLKRHFGGDQSVWCDGDWNGFAILVRGAKEKCHGRKVRKPVSNR